jgi:tripartite ATP-independent transporter DctM subunit
MSTGVLTIVLFAALVVGLILGLPMAWVLGGIAVISIYFLWGVSGFSMIIYQVFGWSTNTIIIAVPLFTIMGIFLQKSGLAEALFETIYRWSGKLRGGLAIGVLIICVLFAAMTGVTAAATITMGIVALPAMLQRGYNKELAVGVIAGGGTLGILIPPSVLMIVFSLITTASVGKLFAAGIIAGLIIAALLMLYVILLCFFNPKMAPASGANYTLKDKLASLKSVILPIILIIVVLGSIFIGVATPTESAAVGAIGAMIIGFIYRKLTWTGVKEACYQTLSISGMMIWIVIGAACFVSAYTGFGAIAFMKDLIMGFEVNPWVLLSGMMIILLILGMFLDPGGIILLTAPIFVPIATSLGFDITYMGILYIISMMIGFISPPFGFNLFYMRSVCPASITMGDIYRSVLPYIGVLIIGLAIIMAFPVLTTTIPNMMVK